jgi:hypothetical protein
MITHVHTTTRAYSTRALELTKEREDAAGAGRDADAAAKKLQESERRCAEAERKCGEAQRSVLDIMDKGRKAELNLIAYIQKLDALDLEHKRTQRENRDLREASNVGFGRGCWGGGGIYLPEPKNRCEKHFVVFFFFLVDPFDFFTCRT